MTTQETTANSALDLKGLIQVRALGLAAAEREMVGHDEILGAVPSGPVHQHDPMGSGSHGLCDLRQVQAHRLRVASRQDQGRALTLLWADRPEDGDRARPLIMRGAGRGPRRAQRRAILFFWPTRASSCHHSSMGVPFGRFVRIASNVAGRNGPRLVAERRGTPAPTKAGVMSGLFWGAVCGFTSMIAHAGGPPFQVYVLPQRLARDVFVGTGAVLFAAVNWINTNPRKG